VECGITVLWDFLEGELRYQGLTRQVVEGRLRRKPVVDYLRRQGRFAHFTDEDVEFFQSKIDEMWEEWILPGVLPIRKSPFGSLAKPTALVEADEQFSREDFASVTPSTPDG